MSSSCLGTIGTRAPGSTAFMLVAPPRKATKGPIGRAKRLTIVPSG